MKTVAVVGAGFAGLAAAYFLSSTFQVTLFDQKGIGGGASGISSGLLHPYPGEKGRRSWHADEAMQWTRTLIHEAQEALGRPVCMENGILRLGPCLNPGSDVVSLGPEKFLITSGITVFPSLYLEGLWKVCAKKGVQLVIEKIDDSSSLKEYDWIVLAAGAGIRFLKERETLKVNYVKGQVLTCALKEPLERSISAKIYQAMTPISFECHIGATYEREEINETVNLEKAVELLKPALPVLDCRAGIRVTNPAHYFPMLEQVGPRHFVMTAFGSRGLLYHGLMGYRLDQRLCGL